jgi:hypothetical protein
MYNPIEITIYNCQTRSVLQMLSESLNGFHMHKTVPRCCKEPRVVHSEMLLPSDTMFLYQYTRFYLIPYHTVYIYINIIHIYHKMILSSLILYKCCQISYYDSYMYDSLSTQQFPSFLFHMILIWRFP